MDKQTAQSLEDEALDRRVTEENLKIGSESSTEERSVSGETRRLENRSDSVEVEEEGERGEWWLQRLRQRRRKQMETEMRRVMRRMRMMTRTLGLRLSREEECESPWLGSMSVSIDERERGREEDESVCLY